MILGLPFVVVFNEMIEIAVRLIEETKVGLRWEVWEEVLEGETREWNPVVEHIDLPFSPELTHFLDRFYKRHHIQVVVPHEKNLQMTACYFLLTLAGNTRILVLLCWCFSEMNRRQHQGVVMSRPAYLTNRPTRTGRNLWYACNHTLLETGHSWILAQDSSKCQEAWENLSWDTYGCCFFWQWTWWGEFYQV